MEKTIKNEKNWSPTLFPTCSSCGEYLIEDGEVWRCICGCVYVISYAPNEVITIIATSLSEGNENYRERYLELLRKDHDKANARPFSEIIKEASVASDTKRKAK